MCRLMVVAEARLGAVLARMQRLHVLVPSNGGMGGSDAWRAVASGSAACRFRNRAGGASVRELTERHRNTQLVLTYSHRSARHLNNSMPKCWTARDLKLRIPQRLLETVSKLMAVGLRDYLAGPRREDLLRTLARKLVGYALGRAVQLSDRKLVDELTITMLDGGRWSDALLVIVRSEQFRCIRSAPATPPAKASTTKPVP